MKDSKKTPGVAAGGKPFARNDEVRLRNYPPRFENTQHNTFWLYIDHQGRERRIYGNRPEGVRAVLVNIEPDETGRLIESTWTMKRPRDPVRDVLLEDACRATPVRPPGDGWAEAEDHGLAWRSFWRRPAWEGDR